MAEEKELPKGLYPKLAEIYREATKEQLQKDQTLGNISYSSDGEIKKKYDALLSKYGILTFPKITPVFTGDCESLNHNLIGVTVNIKFMDAESGENEIVSCFHEIWQGAPFGATITMASKYLYVQMFRQALSDDHVDNVEKYRAEFKKSIDKQILDRDQPKPVEEKTTEAKEIPVVTKPLVVDSQSIPKGETMDQTIARLKGGGEKSIPKTEEKKPDPPVVEPNSESTPVANNEFLAKINEGWTVKLVKATNQEEALKELHDLYLGQGDKIYIHSDYERIGVSIPEVLKIRGDLAGKPVKKTNAQFRNYIIEYRIFGKESMIAKMAAECKMSVGDFSTKFGLIPAPKVNTVEDYKEQIPNPKANENITNQPPLIANPEAKDDKPAGVVLAKEASVDIPPLIPGANGPERGVGKTLMLLKGLREIGIGENEIKFALGENDILSEKYNADQTGIVMMFLNIAPDEDIRTTIEFCQKNINTK